jgi:hypothetical protein
MELKQNSLKLSKAPSERIALDHARFQTATNWGPLGGELLVKSGGKYTLEMSELGVHITLKDGAEAIVPAANVRFALVKK